MSLVFAFTVSRAATPERVRLLKATIDGACEAPGARFRWHIILSGASDEAVRVVMDAIEARKVQAVTCHVENVGQHIAWNEAVECARKMNAKYFLRLDDDCHFLTKRWLKKLLDTSEKFADKALLSPTIRGLKNPAKESDLLDYEGMRVRFAYSAIGGICRLHPMRLLLRKAEPGPFVADVRKPLGSGDATGIAMWCRRSLIPMVYCNHIRVRHQTRVLEESDPQHFEHHQLFQHIPYIPA